MPPSPTSTSSPSPARVLLYRLGSLGDTVVALPSFHLVARAFPHAERRLLTNFPVADKAPPSAAILEGTGTVHGYFRYTAGSRSPIELARLWWQIIRWKPDTLVYLAPARGLAAAHRDARFFRACGIRRLIGVPLTEGMQSNLLLPDPALGYPTHEYEVSRLARNLASLGDAHLDDPASWNLHLTAAEHASASEALAPASSNGIARPFIAISLGTKVQANEWPPERWRELLARLAELHPDHALVITGAPNDRVLSNIVAEPWKLRADHGQSGPVLNLAGELTPRESAAVFARGRLYIGHDSGPMHLAAAVGTPCIGIFSARGLPRTWFPYGPRHRVLYRRVDCWGCGLSTCIEQAKKCILSITVDDVLAEAQSLLEQPVPQAPGMR